MNPLRFIFPSRHVILPVIHVESRDQALRNAQIARHEGADGVFLIDHGMAQGKLLDIHEAVADVHPEWFVGVNCLGWSPEDVFNAISPKVRGVWTDNALIDENQAPQPAAERVQALRQRRVPRCLYFGGVAFKHQRPVSNLEAACWTAKRFMDVVTTSGSATGQAADVDKIRRMKKTLGHIPLAIASGITPENVAQYLSVADCFLVATGISHTFTELDPAKLRTLVQRVRAFTGPDASGQMVPPEVFEFGYRNGRQLSHFLVDITAYGRENLARALGIACSDIVVGEERATHFCFVGPRRLILFHRPPKLSPLLKIEAFPAPLGRDQCLAFVWDWLERVQYPWDEHDGHAAKGFRVFNEQFGIVGGCWEAFVAIEAMYVYIPK